MKKERENRIAVVTSFNNRLFDKHAKRTISTYSWPFPLYVYSEDFQSPRLLELDGSGTRTTRTIKVKNIFELDPECKAFVDRNSSRELGGKNVKPGNRYLYDAVRFCYKPFSVAHLILNDPKYEIVIWADDDIVYSKKKITEEFVYEKLTDENVMMSYYGRDFVHSECGFLVFNLKHPKTVDYLVEMRNMYVSDEIYNIEEQHDSFVWDYVRMKFEKEYGVINKNLSSNYDMKQLDCMASSFMNVYFDHLKGPNKHRDHHPTWLKNKGMEFLK